jgi:hypothetical protein
MARRNKAGQFVKGGSHGKARRAHTTTVAAAPRTRTRTVTQTKIVRVPSAAPRKAVKRRASSSGRKSGGMFGNFLGGKGGHRTAVAVGSLALGYASKEGWLAKLPIVGKAGPITSFGLLGFAAEEFLHMKLPPLVSDAITAALALSAFNIGFSGGQTVVGDGGYGQGGSAVFFD